MAEIGLPHLGTASYPLLSIVLEHDRLWASIVHNGKAVVIPNGQGDWSTPLPIATPPTRNWLIGQEGILAKELRAVVDSVNQTLQQTITDVLITVPGYFTMRQRLAVKEAVQLAGLTFRRIVNSTLMAAVAYGFQVPGTVNRMAIEVSEYHLVASFINADENFFQAISLRGDYFVEAIASEQDLIDRTRMLFKECLEHCQAIKYELHEIILVGHSSHLTALATDLQKSFDKPIVCNPLDGMASALGSAIYGGSVTGVVPDVLYLDRLPWALGVVLSNGNMVPILERDMPSIVSSSALFKSTQNSQVETIVPIVEGFSKPALAHTTIGILRVPNWQTETDDDPYLEITLRLLNDVDLMTIQIGDRNGYNQLSVSLDALERNGNSCPGTTLDNYYPTSNLYAFINL